MRFLLPLIFAVLAAAEPRHDWAASPPSSIDERFAEVAKRLEPMLAGKRVLVAPFIGNRHHLNPWAFETIARGRFVAALAVAGVALADDAPLHGRFRAETAGLPPTIPYSTHGLVELATLCDADVVVLGGVQILSDTTVTIYVHDGVDGHRLMKGEYELTAEEVTIAALTSPASRAIVDWAEAKLGVRFGEGTASGFAQSAIDASQAVPQPPRTVPLPGDVVLWWEPWRRIRRPRCGVVLDLTGVGRADVIVQRRTGERAPVVEVQGVDFHGFPWAVLRPTTAQPKP